MKIDFNKLKKIKELGAGVFGTAYLVELDGKKYVLKTQKILSSHKKKKFKYDLWREMDFFEYVNKLPNNESIFFMKLIDYQIYNKCEHIQKRDFKLTGKGKWMNKLKKLDKSTWCIDQLVEYKGETLNYFLTKNPITKKQIYSFIIQLCIIGKILQKGGYLHDDLHLDNITIQKTNNKFLQYKKLKIPTYGYRISVIDYGFVINNKYKHTNKAFKKYPIEYSMWHDILLVIFVILSNFNKYFVNCIHKKQKLPWQKNKLYYDNYFNKIIDNYPTFWKKTTDKYIKLYPEFKKFYNEFEKKRKIKKNTSYMFYEKAFTIIDIEFQIIHPKKHSEYWGWCSYHYYKLPKNEVQDILITKDLDYLIKYSLNKLKLKKTKKKKFSNL